MHRHHRLAVASVVGALVALAAVWPHGALAASNRVTDVSYGDQSGAFRVTVVAAGAVTTHVNQFPADGKKNLQDYVVDVAPAAYDGRTKVISFTKGPIQSVRVGQLSESPAVMRIVVEAQGQPPHVDVNEILIRPTAQSN